MGIYVKDEQGRKATPEGEPTGYWPRRTEIPWQELAMAEAAAESEGLKLKRADILERIGKAKAEAGIPWRERDMAEVAAYVRAKAGLGDVDWGPWPDPTADPLAAKKGDARNRVACADFDPDGTPWQPIKVYEHDRWPSKPLDELIRDAAGMLRDHMGLDVELRRLQTSAAYLRELWDDGTVADVWLTIKGKRPPGGSRKAVDATIRLRERAFDRLALELDGEAKLRGRIGTDAYLALRIAYAFLCVYRMDDDVAASGAGRMGKRLGEAFAVEFRKARYEF